MFMNLVYLVDGLDLAELRHAVAHDLPGVVGRQVLDGDHAWRGRRAVGRDREWLLLLDWVEGIAAVEVLWKPALSDSPATQKALFMIFKKSGFHF